MPNTILKVKNGYGLDIWGNYLAVKVQKNEMDGKHYFASILILRDKEEISKAKENLREKAKDGIF